MVVNWSGGREEGKLVGSVVAIADRMRDKKEPTVREDCGRRNELGSRQVLKY